MISHFLMTVQWPQGISYWELVYPCAAGVGVGIFLSMHFVGVSASFPEHNLVAGITLYYLFQQLGIIMSVSFTASICRRVIENDLLHKLNN